MNILHTETLKQWGGQQNRVLMEASGLLERGHKAVIACNAGSMLAERGRKAGVKVYEMNMKKQAHLRTIPRLMRIIKDEGIDLVSTHSSVDSWAGGIAAKLTGRRLVRFRHNIYPIGSDPLAKFIYSIPDGFIVTSNVVRDILLKKGIRGDKIHVLPSAVDTMRFDPDAVSDDLREETNLSRGMMVIGNTATFADVKGQEYLLQAFNKICRSRPCFLLFAGQLAEPYLSHYLSNVEEELRDKVVFLGHRDDIPRVLKAIDIYVFPSITESTSTAVLEAMAMKRPIAASDIPAMKDLIQDGINGVLFRVKDPDDIAKKVISLLNEKEECTKIGSRARITIMENFTFEKMISKTEELYRKIINVL